MRKNLCAICSSELHGTAWVCGRCAKEHGLREKPYPEWPGWARALVNQEQYERRYHECWDARLQDLEDATEGVAEEKAPRPPMRRRPLLPYAPYPTDKENRQYRRANGIPEEPAY